MREANAQAQQLDRQRREGAAGKRRAPRRASIHQPARGQAIPAEGPSQVGVDRGPLFIGTGVQAEGEAGAVVQDGERVAAAVEEGEMAFEIHLPQDIGRGDLKALPGPHGGRGDRGEPDGAAQNRRDGARRGDCGIAEGAQAGLECAAPPGRMLEAQRPDRRFEGGGGADPKAATQGAQGGPGLQG